LVRNYRTMLIKELGKQPYDIGEPYWTLDSSGGVQYEYSFMTDGEKPRRIGVFFNYNPRINDNGFTKYQMSFDDTTSGWFGIQWNAKRAQTIKNNAGAVRILTTVMAVLKNFLTKINPNIVFFKGASDRHTDFYRKSLGRLNEELSSLGYRVSEEDSSTFYVQKLVTL